MVEKVTGKVLEMEVTARQWRGEPRLWGTYLQGAVNGEEAGGSGGGSVGGGVLEHQQLAVCLLGEQEL